MMLENLPCGLKGKRGGGREAWKEAWKESFTHSLPFLPPPHYSWFPINKSIRTSKDLQQQQQGEKRS